MAHAQKCLSITVQEIRIKESSLTLWNINLRDFEMVLLLTYAKYAENPSKYDQSRIYPIIWLLIFLM